MKALFVTSECYPLVKTGGLADVVGALPLALAPLGVETRVLLPAYPGVREQLTAARKIAAIPDLFGGPGALVAGTTAEGLQVWLVEAPHLFARKGGGPYIGPDGNDWPDNHLRFAALSWVGAQIALGKVGGWKPDVVHLHDWQAALTAAYLHAAKGAGAAAAKAVPPSMLTIHNLAFQGVFPHDVTPALKLPATAVTHDGIEYWGNISYLKAGVQWCDRLGTVSPTYAREILTHEQGMGFDGLLKARADRLVGIVNGIDDRIWDPATDQHVAAPYSARRIAPKEFNKAALQVELGLHVRTDVPLFCVVSRLTTQKGFDLLLEAMPVLHARGAQLAVLGTGDREIQDAFQRLAETHKGQVATVIGFDEPMSHRFQAGADAIVVPSRFEPCGLTQLYGLRYGTLPVVARVGGLADTVIDANEAALRDGVATGFQFSPVDAMQLGVALDRACALFADTLAWQRVQKRAMTREVGWGVAAGAYLDQYQRLLAGR
ncbi:MAG: glycogen synthase GlgA [Actinomycetota bacterium]|nr:glycogen synthase GlgA [Actinomycetota bacterium]